MKRTSISLFLALCMYTLSHASSIQNDYSLVVSPKVGSLVSTRKPVIIGLVTNCRNKPIKRRPVTLYIDELKTSVLTNNAGVWSYRPHGSQLLYDGFHTVQASIKSSRTSTFWMKGTMFFTDTTNGCNSFFKSGPADEANSGINFPFDNSFIHTSTPVIIGSLLDAYFEPVANETVALSVDGMFLTNVASDAHGVFSFFLNEQLPDGCHRIDAHCIESDIDLPTVQFTVDTTIPAAPVITYPNENEVVASGLVSIAGTAQPLATITTFIDGDRYGMVTQADESGNWEISYTLEDGTHVITAQATSLAGNTSLVSQPRVFASEEPVS